MQVAERSTHAVETRALMRAGYRQVPMACHLDIVLKPLSRPELGEIRIDDSVFAIGRTEQPFASYGTEIVNMLSRRHARIFRIDGSVYLADLESRNGTTINRVSVRRAHCILRDGDEICFGGVLSYRVQITPFTRPYGCLTLSFNPKSRDSGLDTIVIAKFPFLVGKAEAAFSNYKGKSEHDRELDYLSRCHAYIYQKGDQVYIEDLSSSNGTFVAGVRLLERAVPLQDGVVVAFGGKHFVYAATIARQSGVEPAHSTAREPLAEHEPLAERKPTAEREPLAERKPLSERKPPAEPEPRVERKPLAERKPLSERKPPAEPEPRAERTPLADR
jgi:pSer/pThr/pTyr-binding forkhead associated (FHA) protein